MTWLNGLTKVDQQVAPILPLPDRQGHDAAQIEVFRASLLLAEVTHEASTDVVHLSHHIKKERLNVVEKGLVIKEHLRKKTHSYPYATSLRPLTAEHCPENVGLDDYTAKGVAGLC